MLTMKKDDYLFGISMQMCLVLMPIKEDQGVKGDKLKKRMGYQAKNERSRQASVPAICRSRIWIS